jgi:hypothetical protein
MESITMLEAENTPPPPSLVAIAVLKSVCNEQIANG